MIRKKPISKKKKAKVTRKLVEPDPPPYTFCLLETPDGGNWVRDLDKKYWQNIAGGRTRKKKTDVIRKTVTADWNDLDWNGTYLTAETDSDIGWIAPNGNWHPCGYGGHEIYADFVLRSSRRELEKAGWVKVYRSLTEGFHIAYKCDDKRFTPKQKRKIFDLGIKEEFQWDGH